MKNTFMSVKWCIACAIIVRKKGSKFCESCEIEPEWKERFEFVTGVHGRSRTREPFVFICATCGKDVERKIKVNLARCRECVVRENNRKKYS